MSVTAEQIKALRDATGISFASCKKALVEANGNEKLAHEILRKKGEAKAAGMSARTTNQGVIGSYVHTNAKIGVLVDLRCETDFVAKNEEFQMLARDIAMHVAAMNPRWKSSEEVDSEVLAQEKEIWTAQLANEGKPSAIIEKILEGKEKKFREENSLLSQPFVKNPEIMVGDLIRSTM
ncbi:elongation factor Ts, partial [Candidatus Peregrinibacteria bacterium]|nr:elongation factor Ts [Candidatus Peregrinibacteria bacterium]